jgi:hypothetical protein
MRPVSTPAWPKSSPFPRALARPCCSGWARRQTKDALRAENAAAARDLARRTGLTHAQVNAELNRQVVTARITEATIAQLGERLDQADRWLTRA